MLRLKLAIVLNAITSLRKLFHSLIILLENEYFNNLNDYDFILWVYCTDKIEHMVMKIL